MGNPFMLMETWQSRPVHHHWAKNRKPLASVARRHSNFVARRGAQQWGKALPDTYTQTHD